MSLNKDQDLDAYVEQQMKLLETMIIQKEDRWFKGYIAGYEFFALVFKTGSKYGINGGRVSKLTVRCKVSRLTEPPVFIVNYDRGMDIAPQTEEGKLILDTLVEYFENLPIDEI